MELTLKFIELSETNRPDFEESVILYFEDIKKYRIGKLRCISKMGLEWCLDGSDKTDLEIFRKNMNNSTHGQAYELQIPSHFARLKN